MSDFLTHALTPGHGLWPVYASLLLFACLKYLVPIVPGDLALVVGLFWIGAKDGSWLAGILLIALGGTLGSLGAFAWGRAFGTVLLKRPRLRTLVVRVEGMLGRWGAWPLFLNRFLPYVRVLLYPAAGMLRMRTGRVAAAAAAGNLLFGIFLTAIAYTAGQHMERLTSLYHLYQFWLGLALLAWLVLSAAYLFWKNRRQSGIRD
jgi:membrane protein DedA with SNARE-associated domain